MVESDRNKRFNAVKGFDERVIYDHDTVIERVNAYGVFTDGYDNDTGLNNAPLNLMGTSFPTVSIAKRFSINNVNISFNTTPTVVTSLFGLPKGRYFVEGFCAVDGRRAGRLCYIGVENTDPAKNTLFEPQELLSTTAGSTYTAGYVEFPGRNRITHLLFQFGFVSLSDSSPPLNMRLWTQANRGRFFGMSYVVWRF